MPIGIIHFKYKQKTEQKLRRISTRSTVHQQVTEKLNETAAVSKFRSLPNVAKSATESETTSTIDDASSTERKLRNSTKRKPSH
jgi:hypothetical protein